LAIGIWRNCAKAACTAGAHRALDIERDSLCRSNYLATNLVPGVKDKGPRKDETQGNRLQISRLSATPLLIEA
jgi:hypothetical protein